MRRPRTRHAYRSGAGGSLDNVLFQDGGELRAVSDVAVSAVQRGAQQVQRALQALHLFGEQGYSATTVAEIAEAAEVSTKTFFSYFPSKADVLFADPRERVTAACETIATHAESSPVASALQKAIGTLLAPEHDEDPAAGTLRQQLIVGDTDLLSRALLHTLEAQTHLAHALHEAYPTQVSRVEAAGMVGSVVGALIGALYESARQGHSRQQIRAAAAHATEIAIAGVTSHGTAHD
ncbi:TetR family transcriptional regulator [Aeromicrobium sp. CTD01-1L150]|uniref:TetR/AcrR family transcriptional regulator n=1 Tax=Aeromicrobium sp. CTD01-1L150 TaxID=3341830 RepID=UPI0035C147AE